MAEARFGEREESIEQGVGDEGRRGQVNSHHGRIHFGRGVERVRRNGRGDARLSVNLHGQRQQAHVGGRGADAFGHFLLDGQRHAARAGSRLQQVAQERGGDVVGDVRGHQIVRNRDDLGGGEFEHVAVDNFDVCVAG